MFTTRLFFRWQKMLLKMKVLYCPKLPQRPKFPHLTVHNFYIKEIWYKMTWLSIVVCDVMALSYSTRRTAATILTTWLPLQEFPVTGWLIITWQYKIIVCKRQILIYHKIVLEKSVIILLHFTYFFMSIKSRDRWLDIGILQKNIIITW